VVLIERESYSRLATLCPILSSSSRNSTQHSDQYASELGASYVNNGGGQGIVPDDMALMFAPAEHTEGMKRRKERKRRERILARKIGTSKKSHTPVENDVNVSMASSNATPLASGSSGRPVLKLPDDDDDNFDVTSNLSDSLRAVVPHPSSPRAAPAIVTPSRLPPPREYPPPNNNTSSPRESRQGTPPSARPPLPYSNPTRNPEANDESPYDCDDEDVWYGKWWMFCFPDLKR
jgi:hypothetical protein